MWLLNATSMSVLCSIYYKVQRSHHHQPFQFIHSTGDNKHSGAETHGSIDFCETAFHSILWLIMSCLTFCICESCFIFNKSSKAPFCIWSSMQKSTKQIICFIQIAWWNQYICYLLFNLTSWYKNMWETEKAEIFMNVS